MSVEVDLRYLDAFLSHWGSWPKNSPYVYQRGNAMHFVVVFSLKRYHRIFYSLVPRSNKGWSEEVVVVDMSQKIQIDKLRLAYIAKGEYHSAANNHILNNSFILDEIVPHHEIGLLDRNNPYTTINLLHAVQVNIRKDPQKFLRLVEVCSLRRASYDEKPVLFSGTGRT
jgi:hypothetical protein